MFFFDSQCTYQDKVCEVLNECSADLVNIAQHFYENGQQVRFCDLHANYLSQTM